MAGKKKDNPQCIPVNKLVYRSVLDNRGDTKCCHLLKQSPSATETIHEKLIGGFCIVVDEVFQNSDGLWGVVNIITLTQFDISIREPVYICIKTNKNGVLFEKVYGKWSVC